MYVDKSVPLSRGPLYINTGKGTVVRTIPLQTNISCFSFLFTSLVELYFFGRIVFLKNKTMDTSVSSFFPFFFTSFYLQYLCGHNCISTQKGIDLNHNLSPLLLLPIIFFFYFLLLHYRITIL